VRSADLAFLISVLRFAIVSLSKGTSHWVLPVFAKSFSALMYVFSTLRRIFFSSPTRCLINAFSSLVRFLISAILAVCFASSTA
jgi:hypothetical protein